MDAYVAGALVLSGLVGLALGLIGGGGSILAVPILIYVARVAPADAIAMSLAVVAATAVIGAVAHARTGGVDWRVAFSFGGAGLAAAFAGARLTALVPARVLVLAFALLMIGVGAWMRFGRAPAAVPHRARPAIAALGGFGVGAVTGFLGVGGGFLIVPALIAFAGLDMRRAIGTSLVVIALNSAAGLLGHAGQGNLHPALTAAFTGFACVGALVGVRWARRFSLAALRGSFAAVVISVGGIMALHTMLLSR